MHAHVGDLKERYGHACILQQASSLHGPRMRLDDGKSNQAHLSELPEYGMQKWTW